MAFSTMWERYDNATSGQDKTVIIRAVGQTQNMTQVHRYTISYHSCKRADSEHDTSPQVYDWLSFVQSSRLRT